MCKSKLCLSIVVYLFLRFAPGAAIGCFKCISENFTYPACDDQFHNNVTTGIYESPCMGGRKGRDGTFPATFCIKIIGVFDDTGEHITIRGCALDSGTLTTDTEIVRLSHCGHMEYEDRYLRGCLQSCNDVDGCNGASPLKYYKLINVLAMATTAILNYRYVL